MTDSVVFTPSTNNFELLYQGDPSLTDTGIPWDVKVAQPFLTELEALGAINGEVLDIGCGFGTNSIYLASKGYSATGLDGSRTAVEYARQAAAAAGVSVVFEVGNALNLFGYESRFDTVLDSALYHCLDEGDRIAYVRELYRATRPGARWHLYCFSGGYANGVLSPLRAVTAENIYETLGNNGWRVDYLGPTTYVANTAAFNVGWDNLAEHVLDRYPPEALMVIREVKERLESLAAIIGDNRILLPFHVVHATRIDIEGSA